MALNAGVAPFMWERFHTTEDFLLARQSARLSAPYSPAAVGVRFIETGTAIARAVRLLVQQFAMTHWRFYQGLHYEWRWYRLDNAGNVTAASDRAFAEISACMQNAERAGFTWSGFRVHARGPVDVHRDKPGVPLGGQSPIAGVDRSDPTSS